jgi:hypothetical protein
MHPQRTSMISLGAWNRAAGPARFAPLTRRAGSLALCSNGVIDRDELRQLLERVGDGEDEVSMVRAPATLPL